MLFFSPYSWYIMNPQFLFCFFPATQSLWIMLLISLSVENLAVNSMFFSTEIFLQTFWRKGLLDCSELDLKPHHSSYSVSLQEHIIVVARWSLKRWLQLPWHRLYFGNWLYKVLLCFLLFARQGRTNQLLSKRHRRVWKVPGKNSRSQQMLLKNGQNWFSSPECQQNQEVEPACSSQMLSMWCAKFWSCLNFSVFTGCFDFVAQVYA